MAHITQVGALDFALTLPRASVRLLLCAPPYSGIVGCSWDCQGTPETYAHWLVGIFEAYRPALTADASILFFGGIGKPRNRAFFKAVESMDRAFHARNILTWKKRRAYGKSNDYLFCREEIAWYSVSDASWVFHVPYLTEKRGYEGFNPKYKAHSEYKRVSNVWDDIPELMRPRRVCEKPLPLLERLITTHSDPGDLVVDCFAGTGSTGVAAVRLGRRFLGCDLYTEDPEWLSTANGDIQVAEQEACSGFPEGMIVPSQEEG